MIQSDIDRSIDTSSCDNRTSVTIDDDEKERQKKEDIHQHNEYQYSLLSLENFGDPFIKSDDGNELVNQPISVLISIPVCSDIDDTENFDDFDPDNALKFKSPSVSLQASHSVQAHDRKSVKRRLSNIEESHSKSSHSKKKRIRFAMDYNSPELCQNDNAKLLESVIIDEYCARMKRPKLDFSHTAAWRLGPAKYWFDLLGVPESGDGFDYGFELADEIEEDGLDMFDEVDEDAFLMVSQVPWEENIIWDIEDSIQEQVLNNYDGTDWIQTAKEKNELCKQNPKIVESENGTWYSNLPVENDDLVYGFWENEIIWDAKAMKTILQPKILELDPSDENIVFGIPDDSDPTASCNDSGTLSETKIRCPHRKNIKSMLSKTGVIDDSAEQEQTTSMDEPLNADPFNISNDIYYMPKSTDKWLNIDAIQQKHMPHSIPVLQLHTQLIPTYMGPTRLRNFHRTPLKRYKRGRLSRPGPHPVLSLTKYISKKEKLRQETLEAGELFFTRSFEDLSGRDGALVLVEFSEEHPPLMNFVGMCSKIKNYYKRKLGKDDGPPEYKFGETAYSLSKLFLGNLTPGQSLQALENNMYRAPIYEHKASETDFLVIRTRNHYYIREIDALYVAGQQCPLYEVPAPKSKKVADFMRNFLQVFAYKMFLKSKSNPPKIHKEVLLKAFPNVKAPFIKRQLNICANYNYIKGGPNCFHWVLKPSFRLPLEDEIRSLAYPEQCCAYFSMAAAQQRLKDAGYGDKSALVLQEDDANEEEVQSRLDDEIKAAPWNTTRAFIQAINGKCCLQLTGPADPTGCGEAFSYVRVPLKSVFQDEPELKPKKITGTESDLRQLSAIGAETILRNYGVPVQDIKKLTRWELIDAVRTLSTIREDRGEEGFAKFSRTKRFSTSGCQQRYKEECQRIFDLQNRVLSSGEIFSSDDEDEYPNEVDEEFEKMAESIESLLVNKEKSGSQLEYEREEREREELIKLLRDEDAPKKEKPIETKKIEPNFNPNAPRILKIQRTFRNADGSEYTRKEIIREPAVIDAYLRIRSTKDATFIKQYANADEDLERENKKIEMQLKNIKERERRKEKNQKKPPPIEDSADKKLVKVDGTKLTFSMKLINDANETSTSTPEPKLSKGKATTKKRKRSPVKEPVYYSKHYKRPVGTERQRTDPVVLLSTIFEEILTIIRGHKEFQPFLFPVNTKVVRDYRRIIGRPMDLQTMRTNLQEKKYQSRMDFLADVNQIKENSIRYNGPMHSLTHTAQRMLNMCVELLAKQDNKIAKLENAIKPPVDENDQEAFSNMIAAVVQNIKSMPEATTFLKPVNKNLVGSKIYYSIVKKPMDLETISKKIATHKYGSREDVLEDFKLIYDNCVLFNGQKSTMKTKAETLMKTVEKYFDDLSHQILHLESSIASAHERAMRQADIDTSWKYEDVEKDDRIIVENESSEKSTINLSEDEFEESSLDTNGNRQTSKSQLATESQVSAGSLNLSEDDSEDSTADSNYVKKNARTTTLPTIHETSVLEEDLQFSSDDEL